MATKKRRSQEPWPGYDEGLDAEDTGDFVTPGGAHGSVRGVVLTGAAALRAKRALGVCELEGECQKIAGHDGPCSRLQRRNPSRKQSAPPPVRSKQSGYTPCRCRDCMEIAVSSNMRKPDFCSACKEAGCEDGFECRAAGAYGGDEGLEEFQRGIYDAVELNRPGRKNPHQQYYSDEDEDTERVRRLKAISDAVMARKNPKRRRR